MRTLGRILLGLAFAGLGACVLAIHGFARPWPVLPHAWAAGALIAGGVILLLGGLGLLIPRTAVPATLVLSIYLLIRLVLASGHAVAIAPLVEVNWESFGEGMIQLAGAWTLYAMMTRGGHVRVGQIVFALALIPIGLSHFFYAGHTAELIPAWIPYHRPLAYFTGAAHIAAGVGILLGVLPRLAATLEAVMVSLFTLIVWVPVIIAHPADPGDLGEILVSAAISGAAWIVADSLCGKPLAR